MKGYYKLRKNVLRILNTQLPKELYYHDLNHTLSVLNICNTYLRREKLPDHQSKLLRLGALLHDIGFVKSSENHEQTGAQFASELMTEYGFTAKDIKIVQGLIIATKIPQQPKNLMERIICDADLDYLGTSEYYKISHQLYKELKHKNLITSSEQWLKIQIQFLENHQYHTKFAKKHRQPGKLKRITELKKELS
jgi:putative nucleotidyltransferase with HDIG domain